MPACEHLVDDLLALLAVELDLLLLVEAVVLLVAVVGVVVVVGGIVRIRGHLLARHVVEHRVRVDEGRPAPGEHVVVALADDVGELAVVHVPHRRGDADLLQPAGHELRDPGSGITVGTREVAEVERTPAARHLAHAVVVGVLVARRVEDRASLVEVELVDLVLRELGHPGRIGRRGRSSGPACRRRQARGPRASPCQSSARSPCAPRSRAEPGGLASGRRRR